MRINRLYTDCKLDPEQQIQLSGNRVHYLQRVLRLCKEDSIVLFNGDGFDYAATINSIDRDNALIQVSARLPALAESPLEISLVQAVTRGERMDTSLQKATELGVSEIQPLMTERVEVKLSGKRLEKRMQHWHGVIVSACEQSGRARLPVLHSPVLLRDWLTQDRPAQSRVLHPMADESLLSNLLPDQPLALLVGPEGGFSDTEILLMKATGIMPVHFGPRILRTETAGPAAVAAIQAMIGDMGQHL